MAETNRFQRSVTVDPAERARDVDFPLVLRGYDRGAVDDYVDEMTRLVKDLEATQLRENVVQRALDEVGEQTSSILQRAHQTAEEITARSRAKAEGRLQRAEREAELVRREADEYAQRIVTDTRQLWDERQRLIEEMRQLADEVLGTADDAAERLTEPQMLASGEPTTQLADADLTAQLAEAAAEEAPPEDDPADPPTAEFEAPTADEPDEQRPAS
jgi:cell division initiation protein